MLKVNCLFFRMFFLFMLVFSLSCAYAGETKARLVLNMNTGWAFHRGDVEGGEQPSLDDSGWTAAVLPHIMQLEKKHCGGDVIYDGVGWYRRAFKVPSQHKDKKITISFEGVMNACQVFVNGRKVAVHHGGYVGFVTDISSNINWGGSNTLAVRVSAEYDPLTPPGKPQGKMDFYYYSGIYRDVEMLITDPLHITDALAEDEVAGGGVFVTYPVVNNEKAIVRVKTQVRNEGKSLRMAQLRTRLIDKYGKEVGKKRSSLKLSGGQAVHAEQEFVVAHPLLWHPYHPDLYTLESEIVENGHTIDRRVETIGIRTIAYTRDGGFFINGEPFYLRGANRHQAFPHIGDAASNSMQERDVIDLKRGGFNAVRAAHYPQDPAFLAACDKHGLLVVECIPGWQYFNNDPIFVERLYGIGKKMIRRDRNHPSVILWETALNESRYPVEVARRLQHIAHAEYPGDQMFTVGDYFGHADRVDCFDVFYKQVSRFPKDGDVMSNYLEDQIAVKPLFTREWGDGVGEKPRVSLMENEEEQLKQCRGRYEQLNGHGYFDWCMLDANPRMGGHFLWSYNDYARGAEEETMFCGIVDINRYPKYSYYMMQSMRGKDEPMVFIASHNTAARHASSVGEITVFSNCDEVHLYRNKQLIGKQTRQERTPLYRPIVNKGGNPCYVFDAGTYQPGELMAEGIVDGKVVATYAVRTPETAHHLEIMLKEDGIQPVADGSDMIPVYFKVCDRNGTLIGSSDCKIRITVSGEGRLIGDGIERIGVNPQVVEGGVGYALIRTTRKAGKIHVVVEADGLIKDSCDIVTVAYDGTFVPEGEHAVYTGKEEDGVVVKKTAWENIIRSKTPLKIRQVQVTSALEKYEASNITDGDDFSWWIAADDTEPQVVLLELEQVETVFASRIRFQKDSSTYTHKVEFSRDGIHWETLYERECTGWDFKPVAVGKTLKYMRITVTKSSEGAAGLAEVTLYK
ncbi:glycoside hydrolase family 2 TIM barrel-domain containing protein [Bacteroides sp.]